MPGGARAFTVVSMLFLYVIFTVSLVALVGAGALEQRRHLAALDAIPVRVLVNGIRGKSSITRLAAGALRGGGIRVVAKTTGTAARYIDVGGVDHVIERPFEIANVIEQLGIVRRAAADRPDALVVECMAVQPELQELNQNRLIRSNIGVLSNVREDHLEEMGPNLDDVARSLSRGMPENGVCVTAEKDRYHILEEEARKKNCRLVYAGPEDVTDEEMGNFEYFTFKENVAISLAVAREVGIGREAALEGMWKAEPDPGVLKVGRHEVGGKLLRLANIFAANDPNSTVMNFRRLFEAGAIPPPVYVVINCRPDRVERNRQMGQILPEFGAEKLFVVGHPARSAIASVPKSFSGKIVNLGGLNRKPGWLVNRMMEEIEEDEASLVAIGNIHGQGEMILEHLEAVGASP